MDTHFSQRRRLIVRGPVGEVTGAGGVTFVDGRDTVRFDNAPDLDKGRQLTISHLRVGIIGAGYRLNLQERELQKIVEEQGSAVQRPPA